MPGRLAFRGGLRLRRPRADAPDAGAGPAVAGAARPVLHLPRRLRGPHLPPLPAGPDVPPLPAASRRRARTASSARLDLALLRPAGPADPRQPDYTFLVAVTQTGYRRSGNGYAAPSLPPLEFEYSQPRIEADVLTLDADSLENLPVGLDGSTTAGPTWTAKAFGILPSRAAPGTTSATSARSTRSRSRTAAGRAGAVRPAGDRRGAALAQRAGRRRGCSTWPASGQPRRRRRCREPDAGLLRATTTPSWEPLPPVRRAARSSTGPTRTSSSSTSTGDGLADVLITEDDAFSWHPSLGEEGFGPAQRVARPAGRGERPGVSSSPTARSPSTSPTCPATA